MADCDSVSLTRVKPAVRCAERAAPASVVGDALTATTTSRRRREREVEDEAAAMFVVRTTGEDSWRKHNASI